MPTSTRSAGSAGRLDQRLDVLQFLALGIGGADDVNALHRRLPACEMTGGDQESGRRKAVRDASVRSLWPVESPRLNHHRHRARFAAAPQRGEMHDGAVVFSVRRWYRSEMLVSGQEQRRTIRRWQSAGATGADGAGAACAHAQDHAGCGDAADAGRADSLGQRCGGGGAGFAGHGIPVLSDAGALIQAAVDEALGPILAWKSDSEDAEERVTATGDLRVSAHGELRGDAEGGAAAGAGPVGAQARRARWATRRRWCAGIASACFHSAVAPLKGKLPGKGFERLTQALSWCSAPKRSWC